MTRDEILQSIRREHMNFLTAISGIPDDDMINEPIAEGWTAKDMMAHVAMWMRVAIKFIEEYKANGTPQRLGLDNDARVNAFNAQGWAARQGTPLVQVIGEFAAAYGELIAAVESLSDKELNAQLPPPWDEGNTLEKLIAVNAHQHEPEHTAQVMAWRQQFEEDDHDHGD